MRAREKLSRETHLAAAATAMPRAQLSAAHVGVRAEAGMGIWQAKPNERTRQGQRLTATQCRDARR